MNIAQNPHDRPEAGPADPEETLQPAEAATLLAQTDRRARRRLAHNPPWLSASGAVLLLGVYGAIWLSVRGQHPYAGPDLAVIGIVYLGIALFAMISGSIYSYARAGVSGRTRHEDRMRGLAIGVSIAGFYTFLGALHYDGFSAAVVYGVVDGAGPWLVAGAAFCGWAAAKQDWWKLSLGIAMVFLGTTSAFFGPENVWGVLAVGGFALLMGHAVVRGVWGHGG